MPYRVTPLVKGEVYHVFNRSIAQQPIFINKKDYQRGLETLTYYYNLNTPMRFSHFSRLPIPIKNETLERLDREKQTLIQILAFCIMPNHVHFLVKEITERGISTFMRKFQNSYAKYFNTKTKRSGSVFQSMFKAVRITTDAQLLHVARYIHLNPLTSFIIKDIKELEKYPWSSFQSYLSNNPSGAITTETVLKFFPSKDKFIKFTHDQIEYQKELNKIKHLLLEKS